MDLEQLKDIWNAYDQKLNQHLQLNRQLLREMKLDKVKSGMRGLSTKLTISVVITFAIVVALYGFIANHFEVTAPTISAGILVVFATILLIGNLGQIILASTIDYSESVIKIQQQLEKMKRHNLRFFRLFILSCPCYMAYIFLGVYLIAGGDFYPEASEKWLQMNVLYSVVMLAAVLWFNREIGRTPPRYQWAQKLVEGIGGKEVVEGMRFLQEMKAFEQAND